MEIKFRGKQTESGEWYHGYYVKAPRWGDAHYIIMDYHGPSTIAHEVDGDTLGMCTGLKDKNGDEIFEGDIVIYKVHSAPKLFMTTEVKWDAKTAQFYLPGIKAPKGYIGEQALSGTRQLAEVIGNIHDNPDLLKEAE